MTVTSRVIDCVPGSTFFVVGGFIGGGQLLGVVRSGLFYKEVDLAGLAAGGMIWTFFLGRVRFPTDNPFIAGEKCVLIYKV